MCDSYDQKILDCDPPVNKHGDCEFCGKWVGITLCACEGYTNYLNAKSAYQESLRGIYLKRELENAKKKLDLANEAVREAESKKHMCEYYVKKAENHLNGVFDPSEIGL